MKVIVLVEGTCRPCAAYASLAESVFAPRGIPVQVLDVAAEPNLIADYGLWSLPTTIVVDAAGRILKFTAGTKSKGHLEGLLNG